MSNAFQGLLAEFLLESQERVARVEDLLLHAIAMPSAERGLQLDEVRRELHTLKGNAGMMGLEDLQSVAHVLEDSLSSLDASQPDVQPLLALLDTFKAAVDALGGGSDELPETHGAGIAPVQSTGRTPGSVRVPFATLDTLVDLLAEMVIFRNRLEDAVDRGASASSDRQPWDEVGQAGQALGKTLSFIQDGVMALRMVPLNTLFASLRRIVHDESHRARKKAVLVTAGGETPMDKALLEAASEALGHLVRNAITHGLESPEEREAAGKPAEGVVRLTATVHANEVWVDVTDDGRGIDAVKLARAAESRGLPLGGETEVWDLLFQPGFSTRDVADVASGRGMGLSAAAEAVQRVSGRIDVASRVGAGTRFRIRLPLSVSITRALLLRVDREQYALPLTSVVETIHFSPGDGHQMNNAGVFTWRGHLLPLIDLGVVNGSAAALRNHGYVAVIEADNRRRGVIVDEVIGIREIVVKALDPIAGAPAGISGATILGDGRVILILDPRGLVAMSPRLEHSETEFKEVQA